MDNKRQRQQTGQREMSWLEYREDLAKRAYAETDPDKRHALIMDLMLLKGFMTVSDELRQMKALLAEVLGELKYMHEDLPGHNADDVLTGLSIITNYNRFRTMFPTYFEKWGLGDND